MVWSPISLVPVVGTWVSCFLELEEDSAKGVNRLDEDIEYFKTPEIPTAVIVACSSNRSYLQVGKQ